MPRIAIIAEGRPDQAVIDNIIQAYNRAYNQDYEVILVRPDLSEDITDIKLKNDAAAGGLARVRKDCQEGTLLEKFFDLDFEETDFLVLQLDTAEIEQYEVVRPDKKEADYSTQLRANIIATIKDSWLQESYNDKILYAIAIEELEAWMLTLHSKRDTSISTNPKQKLKTLLSKNKNNSTAESYDNYELLTKDFKKLKKLKKAYKLNESLELFCVELEAIFQQAEE